MFDELVAHTTGTHGASAVDAWARVEAAAAARRLAAMATMLDHAYAADGSTDRDQWCIDNWAAVCAHIGAAQRLTPGAASNLLLLAVALRDRFPTVQALFAAGLIDCRLARTIVYRARLVTDPHTLHELDTALAKAVRTWAPMSQDKTEKTIDAYLERLDPDAVNRTHTTARSRTVEITYRDGTGTAELFGTLFAHDAAALDTRLHAFADTVCPHDPRTHEQRRADALGALAHGAERLTCLCDTTDCPANTNPPTTGVIIHLIAHHDTLPSDAGTPEPTEPDGPDGPDGPDDPDEPTGADEPPTSNGADQPEVINPEPDAEATDLAADHDDANPADTPAEAAIDPATDRGAAERAETAGIDGDAPPTFTTPLLDMTLKQLYTACDQRPRHHHLSTITPATLLGGPLLPGAIARRAARGARIEVIVHPGQAPPEPRHRPSKKLADFIRCRDQTCRYPGCTVPATHCDLDHTIPWPQGPTQAANLKALCRKHHLLKTFWTGKGGWHDRQHPNGDVTWTTPDGREHLTHPGSKLLFPELCQPTAPTIATEVPTTTHTAGLTMPRRKTTRARDRTYRIDYERQLNRTQALHEEAEAKSDARAAWTARRARPDEEPPF